MAKERTEVDVNDKWNVEDLYPSLEAWQKEFDTVCRENQQPHWPELAAFQGKLGTSPQLLKDAFQASQSIERKLSNLFTYAHLRHDENITEDACKKAFHRISAIFQDYQQETAWFEPELLSLSDNTIASFLDSPILKEYRFHLEKIIRVKPHTLSAEQEALLALAGKPLQASHRAFSAINDADFNFGKVQDKDGNEKELTHGLFGLYLRDQDRTLRKNAFIQFHRKYGEYENTLCELINGQVQNHLFINDVHKNRRMYGEQWII